MKTFAQAIDKRSRGEMVNYLKNHFRYNTMNSWNNATSYACNLKITHLGLNGKIVDKLFDLIQTDAFRDTLRDLMDAFGEKHNYEWQAGFNGRSGGYLVLYQGEKKPSGYKSYCIECGQRNYKTVAESGNICGRCKEPERRDYLRTHMNVHTFPGRGTDHYDDFGDWELYSLRNRVELVQEFDLLADSIVKEAVHMVEVYDVQDETYYIPQTRKVMVI